MESLERLRLKILHSLANVVRAQWNRFDIFSLTSSAAFGVQRKDPLQGMFGFTWSAATETSYQMTRRDRLRIVQNSISRGMRPKDTIDMWEYNMMIGGLDIHNLKLDPAKLQCRGLGAVTLMELWTLYTTFTFDILCTRAATNFLQAIISTIKITYLC